MIFLENDFYFNGGLNLKFEGENVENLSFKYYYLEYYIIYSFAINFSVNSRMNIGVMIKSLNLYNFIHDQ